MDKIDKFLNKLAFDKRKEIEVITEKILKKDFTSLDFKKLKGLNNMFRVRKGDLRIIFSVDGEVIRLIDVDKRSDKTYKRL